MDENKTNLKNVDVGKKNTDYNVRLKQIKISIGIAVALFPISTYSIIETNAAGLIVLCSLGMFVSLILTPFLWAFVYPEAKRRCVVYNAVIKSNDVKIDELCLLTGKRRRATINRVQKLIQGGYLTQYRFNADMTRLYIPQDGANAVESISSTPISEQDSELDNSGMKSINCEGCGAVFALIKGSGQCPYCRRHY